MKFYNYKLVKIFSYIAFFLFFSASIQAEMIKKISPLALQERTLKYISSYNGINFEATRVLNKHLDIYTQEAKAKNMLGSINEKSVFKINRDGSISEIEYNFTKSMLGIKKEEFLTYDQSAGLVRYDDKKKKRQILREDAHLNNLTAQIELQSDLINRVRLLSYPVIRKGKVKIFNYEILGEELIEIELGSINALKLKRTRQNSPRETFLWFAPHWNFLLVKFEQKETKGDNYVMTLKEGSLNGVNLVK